MTDRIMGIEIGNSNIKIIEVSKKAATLFVHQFSLIETPKGAINNGVIRDEALLKEVISKELDSKKYKSKKVVLVVQGSKILIRNVTMEKQPDKIIRQILDFKTEEYLPVGKDEYQIDYRIEKEFEEDGAQKLALLLVAAPNEVIDPVCQLIQSLKLTPKLVTIPSEALGSVFGDYRRLVYEAPSNIIVIDIGGKSTTTTIISNCKPVLTRSIDFGAEQINETIKRQEEKRALTVKTDSLMPPVDTVKREMERNIIQIAQRLLQFYYSHDNEGPIKKAYLIGGGSEIAGIRGYIKDALNLPVEKLIDVSAVSEANGIGLDSCRGLFINVLGAVNSL